MEQNQEDIEQIAEEPTRDFEAEIAQLKDQTLRAMAETENLRRIKDRQIEDTAKYAVTSLAKDLISVAENLTRTTENIKDDLLEENPALKNIRDGVDITKRELFKVFENHGIKIISPKIGDPFDHNLHQAVAQLETAEYTPGSIVSIMQAGYLLKDRLLRPAMVTVAKSQD